MCAPKIACIHEQITRTSTLVGRLSKDLYVIEFNLITSCALNWQDYCSTVVGIAGFVSVLDSWYNESGL